MRGKWCQRCTRPASSASVKTRWLSAGNAPGASFASVWGIAWTVTWRAEVACLLRLPKKPSSSACTLLRMLETKRGQGQLAAAGEDGRLLGMSGGAHQARGVSTDLGENRGLQ